MMLVRWPDKDKEAEKGLRVVGFCQRQALNGHQAEYTAERGGWAVQRRPDHPTPRRAPFDPSNMFACLHIQGRLCTVHVRGYLGPGGNAKAGVATAYTSRRPSDEWGALCSPTKPEVVAGWASAERPLRPNEGDTICADAGVAIQVLHVSTRFVRSGVLLKRKDPVLDVLLVEEIDPRSHVFRRVGVGRIFDKGLVTDLETAKERVIQFARKCCLCSICIKMVLLDFYMALIVVSAVPVPAPSAAPTRISSLRQPTVLLGSERRTWYTKKER